MHLASQYGQLTAVGLLSELGASLDATDDFGQKPIHLAAQSNRLGNLTTLGYLSLSSHISVFWFLVDGYQKTKISAVNFVYFSKKMHILQCYLKKD